MMNFDSKSCNFKNFCFKLPRLPKNNWKNTLNPETHPSGVQVTCEGSKNNGITQKLRFRVRSLKKSSTRTPYLQSLSKMLSRVQCQQAEKANTFVTKPVTLKIVHNVLCVSYSSWHRKSRPEASGCVRGVVNLVSGRDESERRGVNERASLHHVILHR